MSSASGTAALLLLLASACSGSSLDNVTLTDHGGDAAGGAASSGSAGDPPSAGEAALGGASSAGDNGQSSSECATAADCPALSDRVCAYATCIDGVCGEDQLAEGTFVAVAGLPSCLALRCDAKGFAEGVLDTSNVPPSSGCMQNVCTASFTLSKEPVAAGAPCTSPGGGKRCDGSGSCVACIEDADCGAAQFCNQHSCGAPAPLAATCSDGKRDQNETDVDCGGSCAPCALTKDCYADKDCASSACDAWAPHRCLANHCKDHRTDGDESDIDCGGSCGVCGADHHCLANSDCDSNVCEFSRGSFCLPMFCVDGVKDNGEADLDCGGGQCDGCALGQDCGYYWDCASVACDLSTFKCIADHCADHGQDGGESDVDCGGPCAPCPPYKKCKANSDCASNQCNVTVPHVCQ
ncbi:MAG TPA: hypothetical protein VGL19_13200 [Polyangiaceae bacterium]|jgi:hypothetical protein